MALAKPAHTVALPPDAAILIQTRILAGEPTLRLKEMGNLLMHDPILTMEFLQTANSAQYTGAAVTDVERALSRLGTEKLIDTLTLLNGSNRCSVDEETEEMLEILRYNCRRVSIVSLIIATIVNSTVATQARIAGLFADVGHMVALLTLGKPYIEAAKAKGRKNLNFRLAKDYKMDTDKLLIKKLREKGVPDRVIACYDDSVELKGSGDVLVRLCVRSALELIDAWDNGKLANYAADKPLPSQSTLRLIKLTAVNHDRIYKAASEYLKRVAEKEAPEGASLIVGSFDGDDGFDSSIDKQQEIEAMTIPTYPNVTVNKKSREALQDFFDMCEKEEDKGSLMEKAVAYLRSSGLFERAAVVRVRSEGDEANVDYSVGLAEKQGTRIIIADELSPFNMLRLEIKSTNVKTVTPKAPFGVSAYAVGPIQRTDDGEKVILYADKAGMDSLNMESRRVFRLVLGLLMQNVQSAAAKATA